MADVLLCVFAETFVCDDRDASHQWRPVAMDEHSSPAGFGSGPKCSHSIAANRRRLAGCDAPAPALCDATAWTFWGARDASGCGGNLRSTELLGKCAAKRNCHSACRGSAAFFHSSLGGIVR